MVSEYKVSPSLPFIKQQQNAILITYKDTENRLEKITLKLLFFFNVVVRNEKWSVEKPMYFSTLHNGPKFYSAFCSKIRTESLWRYCFLQQDLI